MLSLFNSWEWSGSGLSNLSRYQRQTKSNTSFFAQIYRDIFQLLSPYFRHGTWHFGAWQFTETPSFHQTIQSWRLCRTVPYWPCYRVWTFTKFFVTGIEYLRTAFFSFGLHIIIYVLMQRPNTWLAILKAMIKKIKKI